MYEMYFKYNTVWKCYTNSYFYCYIHHFNVELKKYVIKLVKLLYVYYENDMFK